MSNGKKEKITYECTSCGQTSYSWAGQCSKCKAWDSIIEVVIKPVIAGARGARTSWSGDKGQVQNLDEVENNGQAKRVSSGVGEFDRALGGGLVEGSVVLLGGDPGIGKSTLILQTLGLCELPKLYVTGEESPGQIADRAKRLGVATGGIRILPETSLEVILETAKNSFDGSGLLVVDSIQTIYSENIPSAPGTVTQVRECASQLTRMAKQSGVTLILIGHVTKDGNLAGPRVLEHLVDTVLYFEGDSQSPYRLIRAFKNRFGAAQEIGAFEMTESGLVSIDNPSALFLNVDRTPVSGSCIYIYQEGPRPILLEVQALADGMQGSQAKRLCIGGDPNRLSMMLALLHRHGGLNVSEMDVFVNVVGGLKIQETAIDLPVVLSLISSISDKAWPTDIACFGEIGLTGEVRPVQRSEDRIKEAARLGFKRILIPARNIPKKKFNNIEVVGLDHVSDAINQLNAWATNSRAKKKQ